MSFTAEVKICIYTLLVDLATALVLAIGTGHEVRVEDELLVHCYWSRSVAELRYPGSEDKPSQPVDDSHPVARGIWGRQRDYTTVVHATMSACYSGGSMDIILSLDVRH